LTRIEMYEKTRNRIDILLRAEPDNPLLESVKLQLQYLKDLEDGKHQDRTRLKDINLGLIAVREIEGWDDELADLLHQISAEVRQMVESTK
jgi:Tsi6